MPDYTSPMAQARRLREIAQEGRQQQERENRTRLAAYLWLAREPQGQVILDDLVWQAQQGVETPEALLEIAFNPRMGPHVADMLVRAREQEVWMLEGERRLVKRILDIIAKAETVLRDMGNG